MKKTLTYLLLLFVFVSCLEAPRSVRDFIEAPNEGVTDGGSSGSGDGNNAIGGGETLTSMPETTAVEITQIIDPNTGSFKKKVSIPKDFRGKLHLTGLNIASLKNRVVKGRFYFGRERTPIEVDGVIGQVPGSGITEFSTINVITFDMADKKFSDIRLLYDLFDYNDYDSDTAADVEDDPTNAGLYCRGLLLEDDPTFTPSISHPYCDQAGDICLYSYANISDQTLWYDEVVNAETVSITKHPSYEQIDIDGNLLSGESLETNLLKCLPDRKDSSMFQSLFGANHPANVNTALTLGGNSYLYKGPYRILDSSNWEIRGAAVYQQGSVPSAIFKAPLAGASDFTNVAAGMQAYMFPRAGKINYQTTGIQYLGATSPFSNRSVQTLNAAGDTEYMDGCNIRAKMYKPETGETISSCNVTGSIELFTMENGAEVQIAVTKDIKLQLLQSGLGAQQGYDFNSLKSCGANRECGSGECCFNNRCFSRAIVGQCSDDFEPSGNLTTGDSCGSDFDCSSLCCDGSTNTCKDHVNNDFEQVLCSKVPNQTCVSKEFCRIEYVRQCYLIRVNDTNNALSCEKRCYSVPTFGDCVNGLCKPPVTPQEPAAPTTPADCSGSDVLDSPPFNLSDL